MAFGLAQFWGWLNHGKRTIAYVKMTGAQGGDATTGPAQNDPQGTAWAKVNFNANYPLSPASNYQQITATGSSFTLSAAPANAMVAVLNIEANGIRYRTDGTAPTAAVGMPQAAGSQLVLTGAAMIAAFKGIAQTAGAIVNVEYYAL